MLSQYKKDVMVITQMEDAKNGQSRSVEMTRQHLSSGLAHLYSLMETFESAPEFNESLGPSDCRVMCWNNCSCMGYSKTNESGHCTWYTGTGYGLNKIYPVQH